MALVRPHDGYDESLLELERVEISDSEDEEFEYAAVDELSADSEDDDEEDFQRVLASLHKENKTVKPLHYENNEEVKEEILPETEVRPSLVDDFIRNFFIKANMTRSLDVFNTEWYEMMARGLLHKEDISIVPDLYVRNQELDEELKMLRTRVVKMEGITAKAKGTWDTFRKERDFHRMHHKRVVQEKNKCVVDIKRLKKHYAAFEPSQRELRTKYEVAMKEKMMMRLERDRTVAKCVALEAQMQALEMKDAGSGSQHSSKNNASSTVHHSAKETPLSPKTSSSSKKKKKLKENAMSDTKFPTDTPVHHLRTVTPMSTDRIQQVTSKVAHNNSVAAVAFHPKNPVVATVSDDETWKLWSVPTCELIMSGEGHTSWIAAVEFHPHGTHMATASGDHTVKLWDFATATCSATLRDHAHPVWDIAFHHGGDFLASASMDHTAKCWDLHTNKCRQTFRGHVDSVNAAVFQPGSTTLCTASGDKTISLWDMRSGLCVQTFYGHVNAVNSVDFNPRGDMIASCDADGMVKVWDVRKVAEVGSIEAGEHPLNQVTFDGSGTIVVAASDDATMKVVSITEMQLTTAITGHDDAVQAIAMDATGKYMASASSDCTLRIWNTA